MGRKRIEPREIDAHTQGIVRLERDGPRQGRNGSVTAAEGRERTPEQGVSRCEVRRALERLLGEVGRGHVVAVRQRRFGISITTIGQEVAGGAEGRSGHKRRDIWPGVCIATIASNVAMQMAWGAVMSSRGSSLPSAPDDGKVERRDLIPIW
jgi:hypothetical protein